MAPGSNSVRYRGAPSLHISGLFMCGYVNAKNGFGAYAGDNVSGPSKGTGGHMLRVGIESDGSKFAMFAATPSTEPTVTRL